VILNTLNTLPKSYHFSRVTQEVSNGTLLQMTAHDKHEADIVIDMVSAVDSASRSSPCLISTGSSMLILSFEAILSGRSSIHIPVYTIPEAWVKVPSPLKVSFLGQPL
jgi:hypothetical protein